MKYIFTRTFYVIITKCDSIFTKNKIDVTEYSFNIQKEKKYKQHLITKRFVTITTNIILTKLAPSTDVTIGIKYIAKKVKVSVIYNTKISEGAKMAIKALIIIGMYHDSTCIFHVYSIGLVNIAYIT